MHAQAVLAAVHMQRHWQLPLDNTSHSAPSTLQSFSLEPTLVVGGREYDTIKQTNLRSAMTRFLQSPQARG